MLKFFPIITLAFVLWGNFLWAGAFVLVDGDKSAAKIHCPKANSKNLKISLTEFRVYIEKMSGVKLTVIDKEEDKAFEIQLCTDIVDKYPKVFQKLMKMNEEAYHLSSSAERLLLVGRSELALQHGLFDILQRLGCRWLSPAEAWHVIPKKKRLALNKFERYEAPDFRWRGMFYTYGHGTVLARRDVLSNGQALWMRANRMGGLAPLRAGHAYAHTLLSHKEAFRKNPNFFAMKKDGTRHEFPTNSRGIQELCYSNPELAKVFIADKLGELREERAKNPYAYSVSMDPNDGSKECECKPCKDLGNGSDMALHLANQVAKALRKEFSNSVVGMYAYASHRIPPKKVKGEKGVCVQVAMGFNNTSYTLEGLVQAWSKVVDIMGIREYWSSMTMDMGLPGHSRMASHEYLKRTIPDYKRWKTDNFLAESSCNWAVVGHGHYVGARLLWDVTADGDAAYEEYLQSAFGKGAEHIDAFLKSSARNKRLTKSNMNLWLGQIERSIKATKGDPETQQRCLDMAAYIHYVCLYREFTLAKNRKSAYDKLKPLLSYGDRILEKQVMHTYALQRRLVNYGAAILRPLEKGWRFNDPYAVWRDTRPLTNREILVNLMSDLKRYPPDRRIKNFPSKLTPLAKKVSSSSLKGYLREKTRWTLHVSEGEPLNFKLPIKGSGGPYRITLNDESGKRIQHLSQRIELPPKVVKFADIAFDLQLPGTGTYELVIDGGQWYSPAFPKHMKLVCEMSEQNAFTTRGYGNLYFYVPKGVKTIYAKTDSRLSVQAPSWDRRRDYTRKDEGKLGCLEIPVGKDGGKVWTMTNQTFGLTYVYNIPPYWSTHPSKLLVPEDLISKEVKQ